jgi:LmbE family N-acetylglucosaminyl deacetylase
MATVLTLQPHQDDGVLAFACMADAHLRAGHRVISLTLSDGTGSGAQARLGLDDAAFTAARDDEDRRALRRLGLRYEDIRILAPRGRAGELTAEGVALTVAGFMAVELGDVPQAELWVKAYSPLDADGRHPDHVASGRAVALLESEGIIKDPRYYVEPWPEVLAAFRAAHPSVKLTAQYPSALGFPRVQAAFNEYTRSDPPAGDLGIGGISVPKVFAALHPNPVNYWHMPVA